MTAYLNELLDGVLEQLELSGCCELAMDDDPDAVGTSNGGVWWWAELRTQLPKLNGTMFTLGTTAPAYPSS